MLEAAFWGFVGGFSLLVGAVAGLLLPVSQRAIGLIMGFGAGVLISALTFELTGDAFTRGGAHALTVGLIAGAVAFFVGDLVVDRRGGHDRKRSGGEQSDGSAKAIVLGSVMDGVPESAAIGLSLLDGSGVGIAIVAAVFLSNVPESLSAAKGLRIAGRRPGYILSMWGAVTLVSAAAAAIGFAALGAASPELVAITRAFAAGAILTMLADTMMPEAFQHGGRVVGLVTVLGFALAFVLSTLE